MSKAGRPMPDAAVRAAAIEYAQALTEMTCALEGFLEQAGAALQALRRAAGSGQVWNEPRRCEPRRLPEPACSRFADARAMVGRAPLAGLLPRPDEVAPFGVADEAQTAVWLSTLLDDCEWFLVQIDEQVGLWGPAQPRDAGTPAGPHVLSHLGTDAVWPCGRIWMNADELLRVFSLAMAVRWSESQDEPRARSRPKEAGAAGSRLGLPILDEPAALGRRIAAVLPALDLPASAEEMGRFATRLAGVCCRIPPAVCAVAAVLDALSSSAKGDEPIELLDGAVAALGELVSAVAAYAVAHDRLTSDLYPKGAQHD